MTIIKFINVPEQILTAVVAIILWGFFSCYTQTFDIIQYYNYAFLENREIIRRRKLDNGVFLGIKHLPITVPSLLIDTHRKQKTKYKRFPFNFRVNPVAHHT